MWRPRPIVVRTIAIALALVLAAIVTWLMWLAEPANAHTQPSPSPSTSPKARQRPYRCVCSVCHTDHDDIATADELIHHTTNTIAAELAAGRVAAHRKHGTNSIEAVPGSDIARWLPILGEEFGEVCESLTYDKDPNDLRAELIDVATVAVAWVAAIDAIPHRAKFNQMKSGLSKLWGTP